MLDIPVFIDRSSYESQPLGRTRMDQTLRCHAGQRGRAADFFANQASIVENLKDFQNTEKQSLSSILIRAGLPLCGTRRDYISNMIELGGARNAFRDLQDDSGKTSVPITMEQFYDTAEDADYLIYNASIDSTVKPWTTCWQRILCLPITKQSKRGNVWTT